MTALELIAVAFGLATVYLAARESVWNWPTGMVNVGLYTIIFYQAKLYADMGLQVVYFALAVYGWYEWLHGGAQRGPLHVTRAPRRLLLALAAAAVAFATGLSLLLGRYTDAAVPAADSALTTASLVAQFLMTRKYLENWPLWVAADVAYVALFISRGLYLTAAQYLVFTFLALYAWREWHRSWKAGVARETPA